MIIFFQLNFYVLDLLCLIKFLYNFIVSVAFSKPEVLVLTKEQSTQPIFDCKIDVQANKEDMVFSKLCGNGLSILQETPLNEFVINLRFTKPTAFRCVNQFYTRERKTCFVA